jgi:uncharacterized membrane protein
MKTPFQEKVNQFRWRAYLEQYWKPIPQAGRFLIVICLIAGVLFRVVNIEGKMYWYDENFTSLRISGYTEEEVVRELSHAGAITMGDLKKYQYPIDPSKTVVDTVKGLAKEEPQLTPLYFVTARFWVQLFGNSVTVVRSFSVLASMLALIAMGWFCQELFGSTAIAWVGVAILALSPLNLLYAQEARPYAWWMVDILVSSTALLRAMRLQTRTSWIIYALALVTSLYTYLFSVLVLLAHALYVAMIARFRLSKKLLAFALCAVFAIVLFSPWMLVILHSTSQIDTAVPWGRLAHPTLVDIYHTWVHHMVLAFVDPYVFTDVLRLPASKLYSIPVALLFWCVRLIVLAGFYTLVRRTTQREWLFVLCMTLVPAIALTVPDLLLGGGRSSIARYLFPTYLGFQLAVTYLLGRQLFTAVPIARWQQTFWRVVTGGLLSVGLGCCLLITQANLWWTTMIGCPAVPEFSAAFNKAEQASLITDTETMQLISASYFLNPKVPLMARPQCGLCHINTEYKDTPYLPQLPDTFSNVFLLKVRATDQWEKNLKKQPPSYSYTIPNKFCPKD